MPLANTITGSALAFEEGRMGVDQILAVKATPGGRSGLLGLERILTDIDGLSFVRLTDRDVVRHRIVQDIVNAYARAEEVATSPVATQRPR